MDIAYDIGANIGVTTALFRACLDCHVVAFEPGLSELACLEQNADAGVLILPVAGTGSGSGVARVPRVERRVGWAAPRRVSYGGGGAIRLLLTASSRRVDGSLAATSSVR